MKKLIALILCVSNLAMADQTCDWSTIKQLPDGGFEYSATLNICVGQLVQDSKVKDQQITDLTKAISLKDLALTNADARIQLWMTSAENEQDRLSKISSDQKHSEYLAFGLGLLTAIGTGYALSRIYK